MTAKIRRARPDTLTDMPITIPVILSGGSGTRLWPLSRRVAPKQLQLLVGEMTMLDATLARVAALGERIMVISSGRQDTAIPEHVGPQPVTLVVEPVPRNTAPAVAAAALLAESDDVLVVLPADHHLTDEASFVRTAEEAVTIARGGRLVTFGIIPTGPETGYGYILPKDRGSSPIDKFVEKPDVATAAALIEAGAVWNSGMFVFPVGLVLSELDQHRPGLVDAVRRAIRSATIDEGRVMLGPEFGDAPAVSIDVAVMEQTKQGVVVPLAAGWSDVGSWSALWELGERDADGNVIRGDVIAVDSNGSYLRSEGPLVAVVGVDDLVVVATADAVLVTRRDRAQDVKKLTEQLRDRPES
jgi:mannose-1-phosphate guanylyltransferase/mannose-6-phosphate isomerase